MNISKSEKSIEWCELLQKVIDIYRSSAIIHRAQSEGMELSLDRSTKNDFKFIIRFTALQLRIHSITILNKVINGDSFPNSLTLHYFIKKYYLNEEPEITKKFNEWKKNSVDMRRKIELARNKFTAHTDTKHLYLQHNYEIAGEEMESLMISIFDFFDFVHGKDQDLHHVFKQKFDPINTVKGMAEKWHSDMIKRIDDIEKKLS